MERRRFVDVARGDVWTGTPRPVVVLQDDRFDATESVTVAPVTTDPTRADLFRVPIMPTGDNGLKLPSRVMADKITTMAKARRVRRRQFRPGWTELDQLCHTRA